MMQWIPPIAFILAGLLAGIIGEKVIFKKLENFAANKQIPGGEIIFHSLHRMTFIWFMIAGFSCAIFYSSINIDPDIKILLRKIIVIVFLCSVTLVLAKLTSGFVNLFLQRTERVSASLISNLAKTRFSFWEH